MKTKLAVFLLGMLALAGVQAQGYPDRPVRVLVGYPPGGGTDLVARLVATPLSERWKQAVVVDNRPGANAIIATEAVVKAKPDGYTLLMAYATELALNPATHKKLPYDPVRDLAPIAQLASAPLVVAVHPDVKAQDAKELIALAKAKPGALTYSSSGNGSVHHFAGELFKQVNGVDLLHIPYKGSGPAVADAVSGQVQVTFASAASVSRFVQSGRLRQVAVSELTSWYGLLAPAGTPVEIIRKVHADVAAVLALPAVANGFSAQALEMSQSSPQAFAEFIRGEAAKYAGIARTAKIQAE
jgi:tripartite-type tricarboxylate transporter receptor subunit TctC